MECDSGSCIIFYLFCCHVGVGRRFKVSSGGGDGDGAEGLEYGDRGTTLDGVGVGKP